MTGAVPQIATAFYINGIQTTYEQHIAGRHNIEETFGEPVMGIYNASFPLVDDVKQAIADIEQGGTGSRSIFLYSNPDNIAVRTLTRQIRNYFEKGGNHLDIIAHSQGTAIVSAALNLLDDGTFNAWGGITIYTFGNVAVFWHVGATYFHCIHTGDIVTFFPTYPLFLSVNSGRPNTMITPTTGPNPTPDSITFARTWLSPNHNLDDYLLDVTLGNCPRETP